MYFVWNNYPDARYCFCGYDYINTRDSKNYEGMQTGICYNGCNQQLRHRHYNNHPTPIPAAIKHWMNVSNYAEPQAMCCVKNNNSNRNSHRGYMTNKKSTVYNVENIFTILISQFLGSMPPWSPPPLTRHSKHAKCIKFLFAYETAKYYHDLRFGNISTPIVQFQPKSIIRHHFNVRPEWRYST